MVEVVSYPIDVPNSLENECFTITIDDYPQLQKLLKTINWYVDDKEKDEDNDY